MIVLDTSAAVELLLALPGSRAVIDQLDREGWAIAAPQLLVVETLQVLRRRVAAGLTPLGVAEQGLDVLRQLGVRYVDHHLLAARIWELRGSLTAYDAAFVALAELLDVALVTADARLARAPGHRARVTLVR